MDEFNRKFNDAKRKNIERRDDFSREKLKKDFKKKMTTQMIGAIAAMEDRFGHLWGMDSNDDTLTADQEQWLDVWEEVRQQILDKGNAQIRAILDELDNYSIKWNGYQYQFYFK